VLQIASTEKGREILVERKIVPDIRKLFDDDETQIRRNAYVALINLS
jgi:vesicle coat complex subunit